MQIGLALMLVGLKFMNDDCRMIEGSSSCFV